MLQFMGTSATKYNFSDFVVPPSALRWTVNGVNCDRFQLLWCILLYFIAYVRTHWCKCALNHPRSTKNVIPGVAVKCCLSYAIEHGGPKGKPSTFRHKCWSVFKTALLLFVEIKLMIVKC